MDLEWVEAHLLVSCFAQAEAAVDTPPTERMKDQLPAVFQQKAVVGFEVVKDIADIEVEDMDNADSTGMGDMARVVVVRWEW